MNKNKTPKPNPRLNSNFLSALIFWWVNPFMGVGAKKDLDVTDLYDVMPGDNSEELGLKLQRHRPSCVTLITIKGVAQPNRKM